MTFCDVCVSPQTVRPFLQCQGLCVSPAASVSWVPAFGGRVGAVEKLLGAAAAGCRQPLVDTVPEHAQVSQKTAAVSTELFPHPHRHQLLTDCSDCRPISIIRQREVVAVISWAEFDGSGYFWPLAWPGKMNYHSVNFHVRELADQQLRCSHNKLSWFPTGTPHWVPALPVSVGGSILPRLQKTQAA